MKNPVCDYCEYRHPGCVFLIERLSCPIYKGAEFKRVMREREKKFGDNYSAEDRYDTMLIIKWTLIGFFVLWGIYCRIKVFGEWWK